MNDNDLGITVSARDEASAKLRDVNNSLEEVGKSGRGLRDRLGDASLAITAIGAGLTAFSKSATNSAVEYGGSVIKLARQLGIGTEETSRLVFAFGRSGVGAQQASTALGVFQKAIAKTTDQNAEATRKQADLNLKIKEAESQLKSLSEQKRKDGDATGEISLKIERLNLTLSEYKRQLADAAGPLQALGVETKNADGSARSFDDILGQVADKFKAMPDGAEKTALSMQLFGRSGKDLIPVLNQGRDGIVELGKEADKLGITLTSGNAAKVKEYIDAQKELKSTQDALKFQIGMEAIPMWKELSKIQAQAIKVMLDAPEPIKSISTAFLAFGGPVLTAAGTMLGFGANASTAATQIPVLGKAVSVLGGSFRALGGLVFGLPGILIAVAVGAAFILDKMGLLKPMIDTVVGAATWLWNTLTTLLKPSFDQIKASLEQLHPFFVLMGTVLKVIAVIIGVTLVAAIVVLVGAFAGLVAGVVWLVGQILAWFVQLQNSAIGIWNAIVNGIRTAVEWIKGAVHDGVQWIIGTWQRLGRLPGDIAGWLGQAASNVRNAVGGIVDTVWGFFGRMVDAGWGLVRAFANGIRNAAGEAIGAAKDLLNKVRNLLPFSDAKTGPLSDLTLSGRKFSETFAKGMVQGAGAIRSAAGQALSGVGIDTPAISPTATGLRPVGGTLAGSTGQVNNYHYGDNKFEKQQDIDYFLHKQNEEGQMAELGVAI